MTADDSEEFVALLAHGLTCRDDTEWITVGLKAIAAAQRDLSTLLPETLDAQRSYWVKPLELLGRAGHQDLLRRLTQHPNRYVSYSAGAALSRVAKPNSSAVVLGPATVRERALELLFRKSESVPSDIATAFTALLIDDQPDVRTLAAEALRTGRMPQAGDLLFKHLRGADRWLRSELVSLLPALQDSRSVPYLRTLLAKGSLPEVDKPTIIKVLAATGSADAIHPLLTLLEGRGSSRGVAKDALGTIGPKAAPALLAGFARSPEIRRHDGDLLAAIAGGGALPVLVDALQDRHRAVRESAERGLILLKDMSVEAVLPLLDSGRRPIREHALRVLSHSSSVRALERIARFVEESTFSDRLIGIDALGDFVEHDRAVVTLAKQLTSPNHLVRIHAADQLRRVDVSNEKRRVALSAALNDAHASVRALAARGLASDSDRSLVEPMLAAVVAGSDVSDTAEAWLAKAGDIALSSVEVALIHAAPDAQGRLRTLRDKITSHLRREEMAADELTRSHMALNVYRAAAAFSLSELDSANHTDPEIPKRITDAVHFSVTGPRKAEQDSAFVLDVWAHERDQLDSILCRVGQAHRSTLLRTKGPTTVVRGETMRVRLSIPTLAVPDDEDVMYWDGTGVANASFKVSVPHDANDGFHVATASVCVGTLPIARIHFEISVGSRTEAADDITGHVARIKTAFASYASEDRERVLGRLQGMLKLLPDLDVFLDVISLRSGVDWAKRIAEEIGARDVFYLFWSAAAKRSPWVEQEWRTALQEKGIAGIDPVPLESPAIAPPPPELSSLHFNEWTLSVGGK